jgi:hypothetical protein
MMAVGLHLGIKGKLFNTYFLANIGEVKAPTPGAHVSFSVVVPAFIPDRSLRPAASPQHTSSALLCRISAP